MEHLDKFLLEDQSDIKTEQKKFKSLYQMVNDKEITNKSNKLIDLLENKKQNTLTKNMDIN